MDQQPPFNGDLEQALLGAVLLYPNEVMDLIVPIVGSDPAVFYVPTHQAIYQALVKLSESGKPIDEATLLAALKDGPVEVSAVQIAEMMGKGTSSHAEEYAKNIHDLFVTRQVLAKCGLIWRRGMKKQLTGKELLDHIEADLFSLIDRTRQGATSSIFLKEAVPPVVAVIERLAEGKQPPGIPSGIPAIDKLLGGWQDSDLIIVAARPAVGKTAFALNVAHHAAIKCGMPVLFFSVEMATNQLVQRLICMDKGVHLERIRTGFLVKEELPKVHEAASSLMPAPFAIVDAPSITPWEIRSLTRQHVLKHGKCLVVVDYLQLMTSGERAQSRYIEVGQISRRLKQLARELQIPVVALSQLGRDVEKSGGNPKLSDLRESGNLEQDADVVVFLSLLTKSDRAEMKKKNPDRTDEDLDNVIRTAVAKQRNGPTGLTYLMFKRDVQQFFPLAHDDDIPDPLPPEPEGHEQPEFDGIKTEPAPVEDTQLRDAIFGKEPRVDTVVVEDPDDDDIPF